MKLFRKLFAEKILRYYEGTEAGIKMIKSFPVIRKLVKDDAFGEKSKKGVISDLRHSESFKEASHDGALLYDPVSKTFITAENSKELIDKYIGYRNTARAGRHSAIIELQGLPERGDHFFLGHNLFFP